MSCIISYIRIRRARHVQIHASVDSDILIRQSSIPYLNQLIYRSIHVTYQFQHTYVSFPPIVQSTVPEIRLGSERSSSSAASPRDTCRCLTEKSRNPRDSDLHTSGRTNRKQTREREREREREGEKRASCSYEDQ